MKPEERAKSIRDKVLILTENLSDMLDPETEEGDRYVNWDEACNAASSLETELSDLRGPDVDFATFDLADME